MKKIYYIGFYSDNNSSNNRKNTPAADTKMNYITSCFRKLNYEFEILSFCEDNDRSVFFKKANGYDLNINNNKVHYFGTYKSKIRLLRVIGRFFSKIEQRKYIKKNCLGNDSIILIYHSLSLLWVQKYLKKNNKKYYLEMEEIYADVIGKNKIRKKEINISSYANGYIFPTILLNNKINTYNKPFVICHGTYNIEKKIKNNIFNDKKIHCVYAGTFDPRKGGCAAAAAAEYLPSNYHVHIIGFGTHTQIENIKRIINEVSKKTNAILTYDGLLIGDDYIRFIQKCEIGLSTQNPNAAFNDTSFPSKILSYMSNGLRVVSIRIPAVEESKIGNSIYYFDKLNAIEIAKTIMKINFNDSYDSRKIIKKLDDDFINDLSLLLENK